MTINIKIFGSGCAKCNTLDRITRETVKENNLDAEVVKVEDIVKIIGYGVMTTPALVINEKVVVSGRVPTKEVILALISGSVNR
jgi:small redox-active disulfide protein 2